MKKLEPDYFLQSSLHIKVANQISYGHPDNQDLISDGCTDHQGIRQKSVQASLQDNDSAN